MSLESTARAELADGEKVLGVYAGESSGWHDHRRQTSPNRAVLLLSDQSVIVSHYAYTLRAKVIRVPRSSIKELQQGGDTIIITTATGQLRFGFGRGRKAAAAQSEVLKHLSRPVAEPRQKPRDSNQKPTTTSARSEKPTAAKIEYDINDWSSSDLSRLHVELHRAGISFGVEGKTLLVPESAEARVDSILDRICGEEEAGGYDPIPERRIFREPDGRQIRAFGDRSEEKSDALARQVHATINAIEPNPVANVQKPFGPRYGLEEATATLRAGFSQDDLEAIGQVAAQQLARAYHAGIFDFYDYDDCLGVGRNVWDPSLVPERDLEHLLLEAPERSKDTLAIWSQLDIAGIEKWRSDPEVVVNSLAYHAVVGRRLEVFKGYVIFPF